MNRQLIMKWILPCFIVIANLGLFSCSDEHFSIEPEVENRQTIWQQMKMNGQLSEFSDILSKVYFSKSEETATKQTYADLLSHEQTFTIWAPQNGSFNYQTWKSLLEDGTRASAYKVENELIRNCMARYAHVLNGTDSIQLTLFNSKTAMLNAKTKTMGGKYITTPNIGASNGVIHVTEGNLDFLPNIYEYIETADDLDSLHRFFKGFEEIVFDEGQSTQGPTIDGNITWVDSISHLSNNYFYGQYLNAYLNREDSLYAMILPKNQAWEKAYKDISRYFVYMNEYEQRITAIADDGSESNETKNIVYTDAEVDSIQNFYTKYFLTRGLAFNVNQQFGHKIEDFSVPGRCDSLQATSGLVFKDPYSAELFDHQQPIHLSNGWVYPVDNFNYRPEDTWLIEKIVEAEGRGSIETYNRCTPTTRTLNMHYYYDYVDEEGNSQRIDTLIDETTISMTPTSNNANTSITLRIPNTMSCKYDIYAVMAYNTEARRPYQFRATLNYHSNRKSVTRQNLMAIDGVNGEGRNFVTKAPHIDEKGQFHFNDSVLLAQDFDLPVCYMGMEDAYVTLEIASYIPSSQRTEFASNILLDKIVLVPKRKE